MSKLDIATCLATLLFIQATYSSAQDLQEEKQATLVWKQASVLERQSRLKSAEWLLESEDYPGALLALGWLADDRTAPWQCKLLVALLAERSGDLNRAIILYREVIAAEPNTGTRGPNVELRLGAALTQERRYAEAWPVLRNALKRNGAAEDPRLYSMLGEALDNSGNRYRAAARDAFVRAVISDPGSPDTHADFEKFETRTHNSPDPVGPQVPLALPSLPKTISVKEILAIPDPDLSPVGLRLSSAIQLYRYAERFKSAGWIRTKQLYEDAANYSALGAPNALLAQGKNDDCLTELAKIESDVSYLELPAAIRQEATRYEIYAHLGARRFLHAATAFERLSAINPSLKKADLWLLALEIQRKAFGAVSFDPDSGQPLGTDHEDFVDAEELRSIYRLEKSGKAPISDDIRSPGQQAKVSGAGSYGSVSSGEDFAEIGLATGLASESPLVRQRLRAVLIEHIHEKKFDLPVKFSLHMTGSTFLDESMTEDHISLCKYLEIEIGKMPIGEISAVTLDAYAAGQTLAKVLDRTPCQRIKRDNTSKQRDVGNITLDETIGLPLLHEVGHAFDIPDVSPSRAPPKDTDRLKPTGDDIDNLLALLHPFVGSTPKKPRQIVCINISLPSKGESGTEAISAEEHDCVSGQQGSQQPSK